MIVPSQERIEVCHPERSEGSMHLPQNPSSFRCAQDVTPHVECCAMGQFARAIWLSEKNPMILACQRDLITLDVIQPTAYVLQPVCFKTGSGTTPWQRFDDHRSSMHCACAAVLKWWKPSYGPDSPYGCCIQSTRQSPGAAGRSPGNPFQSPSWFPVN